MELQHQSDAARPAPTLNAIHHGDCLEIMAKMPARSVDFILTDPSRHSEALNASELSWARLSALSWRCAE
jgi:predicted methyltransferase